MYLCEGIVIQAVTSICNIGLVIIYNLNNWNPFTLKNPEEAICHGFI